MGRRTGVLFLGLLGAAAASQAVAACSSNASSPSGEDSGTSTSNDAATPDGATSGGCTGMPPVMTVTMSDGTQGPPDWSCYAPDASFLVHPHLILPLATDGGADDAATDDAGEIEDAATPDAAINDAATADAAAPDAAADSAAPMDSGPSSPDAAPPSEDAGTEDAGPPALTYRLNLTDFSTGQAAVGASVDILWGGSLVGDASFTGTVGDGGNVFFPTPPPGTLELSYRVYGAGQAYVAWAGELIVPPPGAIESNSVASNTETLLLTSILGSQQYDTTKAILVAGAKDCQFRDVNGAIFTVLDSSGTPVASGTASGTPRAIYLYDSIPNPMCTYATNTGRAVWAMVNAPVTYASPTSTTRTAQYTLQFSGRMTSSDTTPRVMATEDIESFPNAVAVDRPCRLNVPSN